MIIKALITTKSHIAGVELGKNEFLSYVSFRPPAKGRGVVPDSTARALWMANKTESREREGKRIIGKISFYKS